MATSGVQLLGSWASPYSIRVQIALNLKSIDYEFIEENFYSNKSQRLLKANPVHKKIPVLIHDEKPICESLIILQYIDDSWTSNGPSILPSDPYDRAIARFWAAYIDEKWFPSLKELEKASGDEARAAVLGTIFEGLVLLEAAFVEFSKGKAFYGGDNLGYIDVVLGSYFGWTKVIESLIGEKLFDETRFPGLARWAESFPSHNAAKDVVPEAHKLMEFYMMVLSYGRKRSVILEAPKSDPECVLGNILAALFLCSADPSHAPAFIDAATSRLEHASSYEKAVFEAVIYLISLDRDDDLAVEMHSKLLQDFPRDLVSLKRAQVLCFAMGRPDLSLELVEQVLPINDHEDYIYGMLAFPLLELGRMEDAEKAGKKGYEINKDDSWSQHALCHVYQYECLFKEAVEFMNNCARSWSSLSSFMYTHNWWHVALCYLEAHAPMEKVWDIYDKCIWKELERSDAMPAEVSLNAIGLLLRVSIRGAHDIFEDRLKDLANYVTDQAFWFLEWHLDILILWALSRMGEFNKAEDLLKGLKSRISMMSKKKKHLMQRGLSLAEALYKYGKGDYKEALELLGHEFDAINCKIIGASDEQLDVFTEVHISLLLETGEAPRAVQAIEKQLKKREGVPFLWFLLEKACSMLGREEAASYGEKARKLKATYFT